MQIIAGCVAVFWCLAASEDQHPFLADAVLPVALQVMEQHVADARVQENCCGFLFSLSSTAPQRAKLLHTNAVALVTSATTAHSGSVGTCS